MTDFQKKATLPPDESANTRVFFAGRQTPGVVTFARQPVLCIGMAQTSFLSDITTRRTEPDAVLDVSDGGRVLVISDLHMGTGTRDDLAHNGDLLIALLKNHYFERGWHLVLNGDIEDIHRHSLDRIEERWAELCRVFGLFAGQNRLFKLVGNHDEGLLLKKTYRFKLHRMIRIETGVVPAYVYHGHQPSKVYGAFNKLMGLGIRCFMSPFGIRNISSGRSPFRRFTVEKAAYDFSLENNCISIIGHTHRPLFESLGRFEYVRFEIENLCRRYPFSSGEEQAKIETEVKSLRRELGKLKRKERRDMLRQSQSLYGDEMPVPCLFNSGCAIGKKGLNAIELSARDISLVYWFVEGKSKKFVQRGGYEIEKLNGGSYCRTVLNSERLDSVMARIKLLGNG